MAIHSSYIEEFIYRLHIQYDQPAQKCRNLIHDFHKILGEILEWRFNQLHNSTAWIHASYAQPNINGNAANIVALSDIWIQEGIYCFQNIDNICIRVAFNLKDSTIFQEHLILKSENNGGDPFRCRGPGGDVKVKDEEYSVLTTSSDLSVQIIMVKWP